MCAIGGVVAKNPLPKWVMQRLVMGLLFYGHGRGPHSSGAYVGGRVYKKALPAEEFIQQKVFSSLFDDESRIALTHNRFPTTGGRDDKDAHPFVFGKTALVHNGQVTNPEDLKKQYNLELKTEVDSEVLPALVAKLGLEGMAKAYTDDARGSAAIGMVHEGRVFVAKDGQPLEYFLMSVGDKNELCIFGSTQQQVFQALRHVWLIKETFCTTTLKTGALFELTHDGPQAEVGRFVTKGYGPVASSSYRANGYDSWMERDSDSSFRPGFRSYRPQDRQTSLVPTPNKAAMQLPAQTSKGTTTMSAEELEAIKTDTSILPPVHPLGYGWRISPILDRDGRKPWYYSADYAEKQRIKFPKGGGKDRNRNATPEQQAQHTTMQ